MKYTYSILIVLSLISNLLAQSNEFLPLSRYGYGSITRTYSPFSQGCEHAGLAYTSFDEYNSMNPASLGFLRFTDAEIGFNVKRKDFPTLTILQRIFQVHFLTYKLEYHFITLSMKLLSIRNANTDLELV